MFPNYEKDMLPYVARFLRNRGFRLQSTEVPFYEYKIDIMAYSTSDNVCVAVELKLRKWKRAFQQALIYQLCSEYSVVALPKQTTENVDLDLMRKCGIGVIALYPSGVCKELLPAALSKEVRPHYRNAYVKSLCERIAV